MIVKLFIHSAPLLIEPSGSHHAHGLRLNSAASDDNFIGTIYFGCWFKGDKGESAYELAVQNGYRGTQEEYVAYPVIQGDYAKAQGTYASTQGDYAKAQGDYAASKAAQYLLTTVTGTSISPVYAFTKANFDAVAMAVNNGAPVFVKILDNRSAANKAIDLSGIYPAVWNTTLTQIEVQNQNVARGFYLNGSVPISRGCVSEMTKWFFSSDQVKFDAVRGTYSIGDVLDISTEQMLDIYVKTAQAINNTSIFDSFYQIGNMPVNFPSYRSSIGASGSSISPKVDNSGAFWNSSFQVIYLTKNSTGTRGAKNWYACFRGTTKLVSVIGIIDVVYSESSDLTYIFYDSSVENAMIRRLNANLSLSTAPNISRDSILYIINNRYLTNLITVTLHPTALARLTPEDIALASSRNITLTA